MNIISSIKTVHTKPGPGITEAPPREGAKRFRYLFKTHLEKMFQVNLVFVLFCLPVITIPAAVISLNRICFNLYFHGTCDIWNDFKEEFKAAFAGSLLYIIIGAAFVFMASWFCFIYSSSDITGIYILPGLMAAGCICVYLWLVLCYGLAMQAVIDLPVRYILKNAFIFSFIEIKSNLLLIAFPGCLSYLCLIFLPYTMPVLLMIWFSSAQFLICAITYSPIERRVIAPFHNK